MIRRMSAEAFGTFWLVSLCTPKYTLDVRCSRLMSALARVFLQISCWPSRSRFRGENLCRLRGVRATFCIFEIV